MSKIQIQPQQQLTTVFKRRNGDLWEPVHRRRIVRINHQFQEIVIIPYSNTIMKNRSYGTVKHTVLHRKINNPKLFSGKYLRK